MSGERYFTFGPFRMDLEKRILLRDERRVTLRPVLVRLLIVFIENRYDTLTYGELIEKVQGWKEKKRVESVMQAVAELRSHLSDIREEYIETIRGEGYRFAPHPSASREAGGVVAPARPSGRVLVVMPFRCLGARPDRVLAEGITEGLGTRLGSLERVRVCQPVLVERLSASGLDALAVGRALEADTVIDGSVQVQGDRVRVAARLYDADGASRGVTVDGLYADPFGLQDAFAGAVGRKLGLVPTREEERLFMKHFTRNAYAYECYLVGREHWKRRTPAELTTSIDYFSRALEEDPGYALPYVGIADAYTLLGTVAFSLHPPREVMPKAKAAVGKALALDDSLPEAHSSLAFIKMIFDWDWEGSEQAFGRAIKLNPEYAPAHHWYAHLLLAKGDWGRALDEVGTAMRLDPTSPMIHATYGWMLHLTRRHDEAVNHLRKTVALHPHFPPGHGMLGFAYETQGLCREALEEFRAGDDGGPTPLAAVGHALAVSGDRRGAREALGGLRKMARARYVSPYFPALVYAGLGETRRVIERLEKALDERCDWLMHLSVEPRWDALRGKPEFVRLLERMGLG